MNPAPTSQQWTLLRRMRAAGCPIDYRYLILPSRPLTLVNHPLLHKNGGATNVFRTDGQTWMVLYVEMSVASTVQIGALRLRAHWLAGEATLVEPCLQHAENYCLPLYSGGKHWSIPSQSVLNSWKRRKGILSRGLYHKGYILARGTDFLATSRAQYIDMDVCIADWLGHEMVFPVVLVNGQVAL